MGFRGRGYPVSQGEKNVRLSNNSIHIWYELIIQSGVVVFLHHSVWHSLEAFLGLFVAGSRWRLLSAVSTSEPSVYIPIAMHTQILLNQTEIRLYLPCTDWFGQHQTDSVRLVFQINLKMLNTIWFRFYLIRFRKDFYMCAMLFESILVWDWRLSASWGVN